uniref:BPTI/Kunitz inhibitor domain-containing protein n=1 Tax=Periophthalmus magnuspinnatus TaxID=409849 RepID=A0A3B3ZMH5_9GOBI
MLCFVHLFLLSCTVSSLLCSVFLYSSEPVIKHSQCSTLQVSVLPSLCLDPEERCLLPMEEGSCGRYTLRWYFNNVVQSCRPFIYSGCQGNDNRFLHLEDCEEACLGKVMGQWI